MFLAYSYPYKNSYLSALQISTHYLLVLNSFSFNNFYRIFPFNSHLLAAILVSILSVSVVAQSNNTISVLNIPSHKGKTQINHYNTLTEKFLEFNLDSADFYNQKSLQNSKESNSQEENFDAYILKAEISRLRKDFNAAIEDAEVAKYIANYSNSVEKSCSVHLEFGLIYNDIGRNNEALAELLHAENLSKNSSNIILRRNVNLVLGLYYKNNRLSTNALKYLLKAFELTSKDEDDEDALFKVCVNLGSVYAGTADHEKAVEFYRIARSVLDSTDKKGLAIIYHKYGGIYVKANNRDSSIYYFRKAKELHQKIGDRKGIALDYHAIAGYYFDSKEYGKSLNYLDSSLQLSEQFHDSTRLCSNFHLRSKIYSLLNDPEKSLSHLLKAESFLGKYAIRESFLVLDIYKNIADAYKVKRDYKNAFEYLEKFKAISDSVLSSKEIKKQTELKLEFEFSQIQNKINAEHDRERFFREAELTNERQKKKYLFTGLFIFGFLLIIAVRSYFQKRKANIALELKNKEIEFQKDLVDKKNLEISDSINYALRIQRSSLPELSTLHHHFSDFGIYYQPKDVVSGDFYWTAATQDKVLLTVADCTGHGVPGAFTSMIGSMLLNEIFYVKKISKPHLILEELNRLIILTLKQKQHSLSNDGMDMALISWDKTKNEINYSGANRPLYIINSNQELREIKPTKKSVGGFSLDNQNYESHSILVQTGDTIILSSDGYADQFGGPNEKKFNTKNFKELISKNCNLSAKDLASKLETTHLLWKKESMQTDDILVFLFKITT